MTTFIIVTVVHFVFFPEFIAYLLFNIWQHVVILIKNLVDSEGGGEGRKSLNLEIQPSAVTWQLQVGSEYAISFSKQLQCNVQGELKLRVLFSLYKFI